jgi:hypothetical protein
MLRFASRIAHHASALSFPCLNWMLDETAGCSKNKPSTGARKQVPEDVKF